MRKKKFLGCALATALSVLGLLDVVQVTLRPLHRQIRQLRCRYQIKPKPRKPM